MNLVSVKDFLIVVMAVVSGTCIFERRKTKRWRVEEGSKDIGATAIARVGIRIIACDFDAVLAVFIAVWSFMITRECWFSR